jgi:hypothetical protein
MPTRRRILRIALSTLVAVLALVVAGTASSDLYDQKVRKKEQTNDCRTARGLERIHSLDGRLSLERRVAIWSEKEDHVCREVIPDQTWRDFWCIHGFEGSWRDPNAPYYGGLQMDMQFQRSHGMVFLRRKGTANHWRVREQILVGWIAKQSGRGYGPWPNTARYCGLPVSTAD